MNSFAYLTPRIRITPQDFENTPFSRSKYLHLICSPERAKDILSEVDAIPGWNPTIIFEPIPYRCVPEELPLLVSIMARIDILSPNAVEALSLLSLPTDPDSITPPVIEFAAQSFLNLGAPAVVIRSGALGACLVSKTSASPAWIPAYFTEQDGERVVNVIGAGNAFLGGLAAGLEICDEDLYQACMYGAVSSSYIVEQKGLPSLVVDDSGRERWNGSVPTERLNDFARRCRELGMESRRLSL